MTLFFILFGLAVIALYDLPELIRKRHWADVAVFSILYLTGATLAILLYLGVEIPSPIRGVQYLFGEVLHLKYY